MSRYGESSIKSGNGPFGGSSEWSTNGSFAGNEEMKFGNLDMRDVFIRLPSSIEANTDAKYSIVAHKE